MQKKLYLDEIYAALERAGETDIIRDFSLRTMRVWARVEQAERQIAESALGSRNKSISLRHIHEQADLDLAELKKLAKDQESRAKHQIKFERDRKRFKV